VKKIKMLSAEAARNGDEGGKKRRKKRRSGMLTAG